MFQFIKDEYLVNWAPAECEVAKKAVGSKAGAGPSSKGCKRSMLIDSSDDDEEQVEEDRVAIMDSATKRLSELTKYLEMPQAPKGTDVLEWYHIHGDDFPTVTLMWRQFHARPASSAGVERLFSGAGKMHGAEQQNMKSETIQRTLMCAQNCDPWQM